MTMAAFWKADWFFGLVIAILLLFATNSTFVQSIERAAHDMGVGASVHPPSSQVAVIAIDDQSIANIGRWPLPRDFRSRRIDLAVIGHLALLTKPFIVTARGKTRSNLESVESNGMRGLAFQGQA